MITIKNTQRSIKIDTEYIRKIVECILEILDYRDFDIGIICVGPQTIRKYNAEYRNKDKVTDILSFSFHSQLKPGERIEPQSQDEKNLGDLIIAPHKVMQDAQELGVTFNERLKVLLVHGVCHLLGYDHEQDEDYEIMKAQETFILEKLKQ